jgi:tetratricopeptide (TPR) repeat protein
VALGLWLQPAASGAATNDAFTLGTAALQAGQFSDAADALREAAAREPSVGAFVNLGLAEWRRGRVGQAIRAWECALWIDPHDARARGNLAYARQFTGVESPDLAWYERASTWLPVNTWAWIASGSLWLAVGLAVLPGVFRWRRAGWQQAVAALSAAVFLLSLPAQAGAVTRTRIGFVLKKDTPLRLTPTAAAEAIVKLNAGQPLRAGRVRGDYVFVRTAHGQGWIERSQFGRLGGD